MNPQPAKALGRLYQFDLIRLVLVLLALASHFMATQQWGKNFSQDTLLVIKMITRQAMPCLLIIFGFMIEHVYARRWRTKGSREVLFKLTNRAVVCYLAFLALTVIGAIAGYNAWWKIIGNIFLIFPATHANLFKYYTILIPIIFTLTWIRMKFGWKYKIALIVAIISFAELANHTSFPVPAILKHMAGLMLGIDDVWGPSIAHALLLVLFGELLANTWGERKRAVPFYTLIAMILGSIVLVVERLVTMGPLRFMNAIIDYEQFRAHNSYVYFGYGILTLLLWAIVCSAIVSMLPLKIKEQISYFGSNTITLFFFGNFIILLTPFLFEDTLRSSILLAATLLLALLSTPLTEWANKHLIAVSRLNHSISILSNGIASKILLVFPDRQEHPQLETSVLEFQAVVPDAAERFNS